MADAFDLMPSTRIASSAALKDRELAQRASKKGLVVGANTKDESAVLDVLRKDGPHDNIAHLVEKTGLTASVVSKTISDLIDRKLVHRTNDGLYGETARISAT